MHPMIGEGGILYNLASGVIPECIVLMVELEGSIRLVKEDGLVGQLAIDPADEACEVGIIGKCFLLIPEGLPLEASVPTKVACPILVSIEDPVLRPCDASGSNLTGPKVVVVGIGVLDG